MAVPAGMALVPAQQVAGRATSSVVEALTTPIYARRTTYRREGDVWLPEAQVRETSITPAGLIAVGALVGGAALGLWLMGFRAQVMSRDQRTQLLEGIDADAGKEAADRRALLEEAGAVRAALERTIVDMRGAGLPTATNPTVLSLQARLHELQLLARASTTRERNLKAVRFRTSVWPHRFDQRQPMAPNLFRLGGGLFG